MALGVAIHEALEHFFHKSLNKTGDKNLLLTEFDYALRGQNLPKTEFDKIKKHGLVILSEYFTQKLKNFEQQYPYGYELEYNFGQFHPEIKGIPITGKMDKIVYLDQKKKTAKIVDYKSGKPRSIKKGESYWRQLVFYDLLVRHSKGLSWTSNSAAIEFVSPDQKGKIGERILVPTEEDRQQVINELISCNKKLQNLDFPEIPNPTADKEIDFWQQF
jgi:hypothetical protein